MLSSKEEVGLMWPKAVPRVQVFIGRGVEDVLEGGTLEGGIKE
jgi:hypothetical protein